MKITFAGPRLPRSGTVVLPVAEERKLLPSAAKLRPLCVPGLFAVNPFPGLRSTQSAHGMFE